MKPFTFSGTLSASKSLMNRALVIGSFYPEVKIIGDSDCEDIQYMRHGLYQLLQGHAVDCGQAGTVFRFLALRAARLKGTHRLTGHPQLLSRPQQELLPILGQLGAHAELKPDELVIRSHGWHLVVDGLHVNATRSSQFASAVVLNAWDLDFPLHFQVSKEFVSEGYFRMTLNLCRHFGMQINENRTSEGRTEFMIPPQQSVRVSEYICEPDLSSAFVVAALAAVAGDARIQNFPRTSLQPDAVFVSVLRDMGVPLHLENNQLSVGRAASLNGIHVDLNNSPDLFPVLAALCAVANSPSTVLGISHLQYKESSRLEKSRELLALVGARIEGDNQSVTIYPTNLKPESVNNCLFNSARDHRMVMAAQILRQLGYPINIEGIGAVRKSFPEFQRFIEGAT